jgi:NADPH2:quinone reductase
VKQIRFHEHGGPEVLTVEDVADPVPGPGQVLVKVAAAGVNFADLMRRSGYYVEPTQLPYVPGMEAAGTVEAVGEDVTGIQPGTVVLAITAGGGGYAQYVLATPEQIVPLPHGVGPAESTALVVQGLTAHLILTQTAPIRGGEVVLVHAAAGGVGSLAVQVAKQLGARMVIATAGSASKLELARSLGADVAIDYTRDDWTAALLAATGGRKADIVLEMVGGDVFRRSFEVLAPFGRIVTYGASSGQPTTLEPIQLLGPNQTVSGFYLGGFFGRGTLIPDALASLFGGVASGRLKVADVTRFPLTAAADAHRSIQSRGTTGKVVLEPWT